MPVKSARSYVNLPWSIRGPIAVSDDGTQHFEMRVLELPDFLVVGRTESEVLYAFKDALRAFIESYTNEGEEPPHPKGPAVRYVAPPRQRALVRGTLKLRQVSATVGSAVTPSVEVAS